MQDNTDSRANTGNRASNILRLGYLDQSLSLPLLYPLQAGWAGPESPWRLEIVSGSPAALLDDLLSGNLDAAFVTPVALWKHSRQLSALGGWGLITSGASQNAILLAPQRVDLIDGKDVAITPAAQGTLAEYLLITLLKPYYDVTLQLRQPGDPAYNDKGTRLLYGDAARQGAQSKPSGWVTEDLGLAWWILTELPVVWEVLCASRDLDERKPGATQAIARTIEASRRAAQEQQTTILQEITRRLSIKSSQAKELLAQQRFSLGDPESKAMARFLDMAGRAGVLKSLHGS